MKIFLIATILSTLPIYGHSYVNKAAKSIVALSDNLGNRFCTGWVINEKKDLFATADHCVIAAEERGFQIYIDGKPAVEVKHWPDRDVAILQAETSRPALKPTQKKSKPGDTVVGMGYAQGRSLTAIDVKVKDTNFTSKFFEIMTQWGYDPYGWFATMSGEFGDSAFIGGMSGGPVIDKNGNVVAMVQFCEVDMTTGNSCNADFGNSSGRLLSLFGPDWSR